VVFETDKGLGNAVAPTTKTNRGDSLIHSAFARLSQRIGRFCTVNAYIIYYKQFFLTITYNLHAAEKLPILIEELRSQRYPNTYDVIGVVDEIRLSRDNINISPSQDHLRSHLRWFEPFMWSNTCVLMEGIRTKRLS
jgi:hypothetical protein